MKRYGNLWQQVCTYENIDKAIRLTFRGKRRYNEFKEIEKNLPYYREQLHEMLVNESYTYGEYTIKHIYEPKPRTALVARTFPDRFLHHAIVNVGEPIWSSRTYYHSYACIKGKGTHAAHRQIAKLVAGYNYICHLDIHSFYASIDHDVLKQALRRKIKDVKFLRYCDGLIDNYPTPCGIPIGNATSPWFGNVALWGVDDFIKHELKLPYVRYNDDMVIASNDKSELVKARERVRGYLWETMGLTFSKSYIKNTRQGINAVGYHSYKNRKSDTVTILKRKTARKIRLFVAEKATTEALKSVKSANKVLRVLTSYNGILTNCSCNRFIEKIDFNNKLELFKIKGHEMIKQITEYYNNGILTGETLTIETVAGLHIYISGIQQTKNKYYHEYICEENGEKLKQTNGKNPTLSVIQFYIAAKEHGKEEKQIRESGKLYKVFSSAYSITNAAEAMKDIDFKNDLVSAMFTKSGKHPELVPYESDYAQKKGIDTAGVLQKLETIAAAS